MSTLSYVLLIIATIPVIAYPMVLIAGLMSIAGYKLKKPKSSLYSVLFRTFVILSLAYPLALILGWIFAKKAAGNTPFETLFASIPLLYLLILVVLFKIVISLERKIFKQRDIQTQELDD